jgi:hypothetical protein
MSKEQLEALRDRILASLHTQFATKVGALIDAHGHNVPFAPFLHDLANNLAQGFVDEPPVSTITITLEVEGDADAASQVVEHFLDEGTLQDAINEHEAGCKILSVVSS